MKELTHTDEMTLENLIDQYSLKDIVQAMVKISNEKAEHIRVNWQDNILAMTWEHDARKLEKIVIIN